MQSVRRFDVFKALFGFSSQVLLSVVTFPVLPDPDLQIADRYKVTGYPETFLIDRSRDGTPDVNGHRVIRDLRALLAVGA